ncbi:hypothetical protein [Silvimonas iriomotensis]|nr:hypothetical protein [Silvimonas iriomotensis]
MQTRNPEHEAADLAKGVARVGGEHIPLNYLAAYMRASACMLEKATEVNDLDQLCIPLLMLQRHALELMLKDILTLIYDADDYQYLAKHPGAVVLPLDNEKRRKAMIKHDLVKLAQMLKDGANALQYAPPPAGLMTLAEDISKLEKNSPTFTRYSESTDKLQHLPAQVIIPVRDYQDRLNALYEEIFGLDAITGDNYSMAARYAQMNAINQMSAEGHPWYVALEEHLWSTPAPQPPAYDAPYKDCP